LLHLFGYLYYWQMGFNSVFKGLNTSSHSSSWGCNIRHEVHSSCYLSETLQAMSFRMICAMCSR